MKVSFPSNSNSSGPRLLAATEQLTVTGGFGDLGPRRTFASVVLDGAEAFRDACRKAARDGVDIFKIVPSAPGSGPDPLAELAGVNLAQMVQREIGPSAA